MKLRVIGKYGPFAMGDSCTSGYLVKSEKTCIALEMGSGIFSHLTKIMKPEDLDAIVISHFHFDHIADLFILEYYLRMLTRNGVISKRIPLYVPFDTCQEYDLFYRFKAFDITTVKTDTIYKIGDFEVEFLEMKHSFNTVGMRFQQGGKVLSYSADTILNKNIDRLVEGSNLFLCDASTRLKDWKKDTKHMSVTDGANLAKQFNVKMLMTHLNPFDDEKEVLQEALDTGANAEISQEMTEYDI